MLPFVWHLEDQPYLLFRAPQEIIRTGSRAKPRAARITPPSAVGVIVSSIDDPAPDGGQAKLTCRHVGGAVPDVPPSVPAYPTQKVAT